MISRGFRDSIQRCSTRVSGFIPDKFQNALVGFSRISVVVQRGSLVFHGGSRNSFRGLRGVSRKFKGFVLIKDSVGFQGDWRW